MCELLKTADNKELRLAMEHEGVNPIVYTEVTAFFSWLLPMSSVESEKLAMKFMLGQQIDPGHSCHNEAHYVGKNIRLNRPLKPAA